MADNRPIIYTVSQVNTLIKTVLENHLPPRLGVSGEISDWKIHRPRGHCYFSLKDAGGLLPCVMWADRFKQVKFTPDDGLAVVATGHIDVYPPQGRYQFYVESMQPAGVGALQLAFEQMVKRLAAQGLFDEAHKKPLPPYPMRIGVVTSESGAAIHDISDSIFNRWPCAKLFLYAVPVQGEGAAAQIAAAIRDINRRNARLRLEILIVGRGGGSLEDLWAFNEEAVARAIYDSKVPVISAVGHEVDTTIADLVADKRASTPTKAGVVAVPDYREVLKGLAAAQNRLAGKVESVVELAGQKLETLLASAVFRNPLSIVRNREQMIDGWQTAAASAWRETLAAAKDRLAAMHEKVARLEPHRLLARTTVELNNLGNRTVNAAKQAINKAKMALTAQANLLAGLNPRSVLKRGYSMTTVKATGIILRRPEEVVPGDLLVTELADQNSVESRVTKK